MGCHGRIATLALAALLASPFGAEPAAASPTLDATLGTRLRNGASGEFASVSIRETGDGGLEFSIRLLGDLGPSADLGKLYFNLPRDVSGLAVETQGDVQRAFDLRPGRRARGGNDSRFDFAVRFGKQGRDRNGNGTLQEATFVLRGDRKLTLEDLLGEPSETNRGLEAQLALYVGGASGSGPTVAGLLANPVPEPGTALLLGGGLLALAAARRRR